MNYVVAAFGYEINAVEKVFLECEGSQELWKFTRKGCFCLAYESKLDLIKAPHNFLISINLFLVTLNVLSEGHKKWLQIIMLFMCRALYYSRAKICP